MRRLYLAIALTLIHTPSLANQETPTQGFYGNFSLFFGAQGTNSNLSTETNASVGGYEASADNENQAVVIPYWDIAYRFNPKYELYFNTDIVGMANDFYLQTGYRYSLDDGSQLALGFVPGLLEKEVWQNPYQLGASRETTDSAVQGIVANYDQILGSDWSLELALGKYQVDQEKSVSATAGF